MKNTIKNQEAFPNSLGTGLTKHQLFSVIILSGLVSYGNRNEVHKAMVEEAVELADLLINKLDNNP